MIFFTAYLVNLVETIDLKRVPPFLGYHLKASGRSENDCYRHTSGAAAAVHTDSAPSWRCMQWCADTRCHHIVPTCMRAPLGLACFLCPLPFIRASPRPCWDVLLQGVSQTREQYCLNQAETVLASANHLSMPRHLHACNNIANFRTLSLQCRVVFEDALHPSYCN